MYNLYPRYSASTPTDDSGSFPFPIQLMKTGDVGTATTAGSTLLDAPQSVWWDGPAWNQYTAMQHYCDFQFAGPESPFGMPRYCDNDPLPLADRITFCNQYKPQYVYAGYIISDLSLSDLCPFLNPAVPNSAAYEYCLVFADHPK